MAYQALYRKWRPRTFRDVLGQEAVVRTLCRQITTGRIAHAYLFCGCRGTGKTSIAKIMSRAINCLCPEDGNPCGKCESCLSILNETTMDVVEMDAASHSRVEEMRDLLDRVMYPPQFGKFKVYIIDEVHMLSASAFNALLKTLEEPPAHVVFILATTEPQKLPATILSRVQRYDFGRIPVHLMVERMTEALNELGITADAEALGIVANSAEGAMRDAFSILDICVAAAQDNRITAAGVRELLGTSDPDFLFSFFEAMKAADYAALLKMIDTLMRSGREPQVFLKEAAAHARALLTVRTVGNSAAELLNCTPEEAQRLARQAEMFSSNRLLRILDTLTRAEGELRYASTPRIGLESAVLHACEENRGEDTAALLERIAELETKLRAVENKLTSGNFTVQAVSAGKRADTSAEKDDSAKKAAAPEPPKSEKELWQAFLSAVQKQSPPLFGQLCKVKFSGVQADTVLCTVSAEAVSILDILTKQKHVDTLSAILSEVCGKPMLFSASGREQQPQNRHSAASEASEKQLIEVFERENVQISEGESH